MARQLLACALTLLVITWTTASELRGDLPGIEVAARQALLDYSTQQGLAILRDRVTQLVIPDVSKTFNVPVVGDFKLQVGSG